MLDNDLISREAARDVINTWGLHENEDIRMNLLHNDLNALPAVDAAPVVRCKDCMYWRETGEGIGECKSLEVADSDPEITHAFQTTHDWLCADAERADPPTCCEEFCEIGGEDDAGQ